MRERMGQRLAELNAEYEAGQKLLADLQANQASVEQTLLRISGAIEVLEELLSTNEGRGVDGGRRIAGDLTGDTPAVVTSADLDRIGVGPRELD